MPWLRLQHEFAFSSGSNRDYLIVERSIKTHDPSVAAKQIQAWATCRSQQRHRARELPVPPRFESEWQATLASRDRRSSGRVQTTGTALVHGGVAVHARILDLAIGGVRLLVDDQAALPDSGARVRLDLRTDRSGGWLTLIGYVVRVEARGSGAALAIEVPVAPPDFEDLVQDELLATLECTQVPWLLLVDRERGRRELVADAFRAAGCRVIEMSCPLEAIVEIERSRLHLWAAVIADTKLASHADELRKFLRDTYPGVPQIDVGQRLRKNGSASLGVDGVPDLAVQIFNLVRMPAQLSGAV